VSSKTFDGERTRWLKALSVSSAVSLSLLRPASPTVHPSQCTASWTWNTPSLCGHTSRTPLAQRGRHRRAALRSQDQLIDAHFPNSSGTSLIPAFHTVTVELRFSSQGYSRIICKSFSMLFPWHLYGISTAFRLILV
jgi:hypothetical protein